MRVPTLIPPGIEAAAWRFAKASLRDGHDKYASTMLAREGVPRIIEFYDNDGTQHFCENIKGCWYELFDDLDGDSDAK